MTCQVNFPLQDVVLLLRDKINPEAIGAVSQERLEEEVLLFIQPKIDAILDQLSRQGTETFVSSTRLNGNRLEVVLNNGTVIGLDLSPLTNEFVELARLYDTSVPGRIAMGASNNASIVFFLQDNSATVKADRPWLPNGLTMGETHYQTTGTEAPTTGVWDQGNVMWNEQPTSGAPIGWVCVAGGSPGTWKTFGLID